MALRPEQIKIINYYEEWYHSNDDIDKKAPDIEQMGRDLDMKAQQIFTFLRLDSTIEALERRGIKLPGTINGLTAEQLAVANIILDFTDRRPQKKKLEELGIGSQRYQGWLKQPEFQRYIRGRAEALLGNVQHEAHAALLGNIQRGDFQSIKLYYEMTGRWSSKTAGDLNIQFIMMKVIESVQRNVKDPVAIQQIANDIAELLPGDVNGMGAVPPVEIPETIPMRAIETKDTA
jgi:Helix-turn-helix of insertion element transposase